MLVQPPKAIGYPGSSQRSRCTTHQENCHHNRPDHLQRFVAQNHIISVRQSRIDPGLHVVRRVVDDAYVVAHRNSDPKRGGNTN